MPLVSYPKRALTRSGFSYGLSNVSNLEDEPFSHASLDSLSPKITGIRSAITDNRNFVAKAKLRNANDFHENRNQEFLS